MINVCSRVRLCLEKVVEEREKLSNHDAMRVFIEKEELQVSFTINLPCWRQVLWLQVKLDTVRDLYLKEKKQMQAKLQSLTASKTRMAKDHQQALHGAVTKERELNQIELVWW